MIAQIQGEIIEKSPSRIVVSVGGLAFEISVPTSTFENQPPEGEKTRLYTFLQPKEDEFVLYGFASRAEKELFMKLKSVSGIGAKTALGILSGISVENFISAISRGDSKFLTMVPGIGKKTAERLIFELAGHIDALSFIEYKKEDIRESDIRTQAIEALIGAGCKPNIARQSVETASKSLGNNVTLEDLIREALKYR